MCQYPSLFPLLGNLLTLDGPFILLEFLMLIALPAMHSIGQMSAFLTLLREIPSLAYVAIRARLPFQFYSLLLLSWEIIILDKIPFLGNFVTSFAHTIMHWLLLLWGE
jgi:hypothetical protein